MNWPERQPPMPNASVNGFRKRSIEGLMILERSPFEDSLSEAREATEVICWYNPDCCEDHAGIDGAADEKQCVDEIKSGSKDSDGSIKVALIVDRSLSAWRIMQWSFRNEQLQS